MTVGFHVVTVCYAIKCDFFLLYRSQAFRSKRKDSSAGCQFSNGLQLLWKTATVLLLDSYTVNNWNIQYSVTPVVTYIGCWFNYLQSVLSQTDKAIWLMITSVFDCHCIQNKPSCSAHIFIIICIFSHNCKNYL